MAKKQVAARYEIPGVSVTQEFSKDHVNAVLHRLAIESRATKKLLRSYAKPKGLLGKLGLRARG